MRSISLSSFLCCKTDSAESPSFCLPRLCSEAVSSLRCLCAAALASAATAAASAAATASAAAALQAACLALYKAVTCVGRTALLLHNLAARLALLLDLGDSCCCPVAKLGQSAGATPDPDPLAPAARPLSLSAHQDIFSLCISQATTEVIAMIAATLTLQPQRCQTPQRDWSGQLLMFAQQACQIVDQSV